MKRELVEKVEKQKDLLVAALWANTNWDGEEADRGKALEDIEDNFNKTVEMIHTGKKPKEASIDWEDPFFSSVKKGMDAIVIPREDEGSTITAGEVVDLEKRYEGLDIDQM